MRRSVRPRGLVPVVAVAILGLGGLAGCGSAGGTASVGQVVDGRDDQLPGDGADVRTPVGTLTLHTGAPVDHVDADLTASLDAVDAPDGGRLVPVSWTFANAAPSGVGLLATGTAQPVVSVVTADGTYQVGTPYAVSGGSLSAAGDQASFFVAVPGADSQVSLSVEYDGLTQTVAPDGTVQAGAASALADLSAHQPALERDCADDGWTATAEGATRPVQIGCDVSTPLLTPYLYGAGWAPDGSLWLATTVTTDGALVRLDGRLQEATGVRGDPTDTLDGAAPSSVVAAAPGSTAASATAGTDVFTVADDFAGGTLRLERGYRAPGGDLSATQSLRVTQPTSS